MMATPSKLSRSKRKERRNLQRSIISLISDEDDEKENSVDKSKQGRSRVVNRGRRRESTILAGNLSYQVGIVI